MNYEEASGEEAPAPAPTGEPTAIPHTLWRGAMTA
jgi:hypothetical protein